MTGALAVTLASTALAAAATFAWLRARRANARTRGRLAAASEELERLEQAFARFAPMELVERVIARGIATSGERKEVTVLFADLVGFTPLSESVDPATLVRILNGYFERMSRAITAHQGHISTLIGDGILALFGALEANPWQTNDAARAALAMRGELAAYNAELAQEGLPKLALGIGLHRGSGIAGLVGSPELMQFTVVGTVVSVAARVQGLTRAHGVDVLLTSAVHAALDPRFVLRALPPAALKGISEPVSTFALLSE
ncbi:MAG TPA: adenylate/guanylate cyclase domain-containing protein [Myxococcota bacterium]|nr:adenylate/guanylate cyclase domain-containing protein [Myxococcota bacterium]